MKTPTSYLSKSQGMWRLINQGLPLCVDYPTRQVPEKVAQQYNLDLSHNIIWNGDIGSWEEEKVVA